MIETAEERTSGSFSDAADPHVLIVEDDRSLGEMLQITLRERGLDPTLTSSGQDALRAFIDRKPDVVLLDLGLPDLDGVEVCRRLRRWSTVPIVVITADGAEERVIEALDSGADDYITKPFSLPQLLARVRVALRHATARDGAAGRALIEIGDLVVDIDAHAALAGGQVVALTHREFATLVALATNADRVVSVRTLSVAARGADEPVHSPYVRNVVTRVRKAIGEGRSRPRIEAVSGVGYTILTPPVSGWPD